MTGPSLKYPGAKWGRDGATAQWIVRHLPPHVTYTEPFFGSGGVFFTKAPSRAEYINDLDGDITNLFTVLRDQPDALIHAISLTPYARAEYELSVEPWPAGLTPLERARRTLVRHWMSVGGNGGGRYVTGWRHSGPKGAEKKNCSGEWTRLPERLAAHAQRLMQAHIDNRPALEHLGRLNHPNTLAYIDPPYPASTRTGRLYREEMLEDAQHIELLEFLVQDWQGAAVLSGYSTPLYDALLGDWMVVTREVQAEMNQSRTEVLWLNPVASAAMSARQQAQAIAPASLFGGTA